ncbi:MAG: hypothetical protein GX139_07350 [Armatimonadetes bacterium]|jgi:serine/threonine protein kinase|nr:hypothetical protein [Armatimonadota bacterium]
MTIPSRTDIERLTKKYLRRAGGTRPDLRVVDMPDGKIVVKDYKHSDKLFRLLIGPILIHREAGALKILKGVSGVPQFIGKIDRYAFAMQYVPGTSLADDLDHPPAQEFYDELRRVVDDIHSRGVAHCDLFSTGNIMYGDDDQPYVVDFAASVFRGKGINPFTRKLHSSFVSADRIAVLKAKKRLSPHLLTDKELEKVETPLPFEKPARAFGSFIRKVTRALLTKKR